MPKAILLDRVNASGLRQDRIKQDHSFVLDASAVECIERAKGERINPQVLLENARLPFPRLWIEYESSRRGDGRWSKMGPPVRTGFLFSQTEDLIDIGIFDQFGLGEVFFYPLLLGFSVNKFSKFENAISTEEEKRILWGPCKTPAPIEHIGFSYIESEIESRKELIRAGKKFLEHLKGDLSFCIFALALLNTSCGVARETITQGRWIYKGNPKPLSNYTTISINLERRYVNRPGKMLIDRIVSYHKRLHEVRGHWRQLGQGETVRKVWVRNHQRGDELIGKIIQQREVVDRSVPANPTIKEQNR